MTMERASSHRKYVSTNSVLLMQARKIIIRIAAVVATATATMMIWIYNLKEIWLLLLGG